MSRNQQKQTLKYFSRHAAAWFKQAKFQKKGPQSSAQQRNNFVFEYLKKNRIKNFLDIGCGTGNLVYEASKVTKFSHGIDFAKSMIVLAKKKFKQKNLKFENIDALKFNSDVKYDVVAANGFIEYFSKKDLEKITKKIHTILKKNGVLLISSRNRLFNIFSLNNFTNLEINSKKIPSLLNETMQLINLDFKSFKKIRGLKFETINYKQPKTGVNVDLINQYTPKQLINFYAKNGFEAINISGINYHSVIPSFKTTNYVNEFNSKIVENNYYNKKIIPFSSSLMLILEKK
jgi:2-polyprenyl-3-methyl-5-hydroxy-6-metoxy-1,4-benzoquinol methylase